MRLGASRCIEVVPSVKLPRVNERCPCRGSAASVCAVIDVVLCLDTRYPYVQNHTSITPLFDMHRMRTRADECNAGGEYGFPRWPGGELTRQPRLQRQAGSLVLSRLRLEGSRASARHHRACACAWGSCARDGMLCGACIGQVQLSWAERGMGRVSTRLAPLCSTLLTVIRSYAVRSVESKWAASTARDVHSVAWAQGMKEIQHLFCMDGGRSW